MPSDDILGELEALRSTRGMRRARDEAAHVTGRARFTLERPAPAGLLHAVPATASVTVGRIVQLDLSRAADAPGVVAVLSADDIPGVNDFADPPTGEDWLIASERVGFRGQVLYLVVAETVEEARAAMQLARVSISPGMPVLDIDDALNGASLLEPDYTFQRGNVADAIDKAPRRVDGRLQVGGQDHAALELQGAIAEPDGEGGMVIHAATEHPASLRRVVARVLAQPESALAVEVRRLGGGLGGKRRQATQWAALAALAAFRTGRPCVVSLHRAEDMALTGKSHDVRADYQAGFTEAGQIRAVDVRLAARGGHSRDGTTEAVDGAMFHADNAYHYPVNRIVGRRLRTNTVSSTVFRGAGAPPGILFAERLMDHVACALRLDPLDVRKANLYAAEGRDMTPYGMSVGAAPLAAIIDRLEEESEYRRRREAIAAANARSPILKQGIALTPLKYGVGEPDVPEAQAAALVQLGRDGALTVTCSGVESGQGLHARIAARAAGRFTVPVERVRLGATSTRLFDSIGPGGLAVEIDVNLMALDDACDQLIARLMDFCAARWQADRSAIALREGRVVLQSRSFSMQELAEAAHGARVALSALGHARTPTLSWMRDFVTGRPFHYFVHGAACSEVTIDTMTGEMRVDRVDILLDAGRRADPARDRVSVEAGFVLGLGGLTSEELVWDSAGNLVTRTLASYKIPTASMVPADFRIAFFEREAGEEEGVPAEKALTDAPVMLAASVFSALTDAVASLRPGVMPRLDAPATPEAIVRAVRGMASASR